MNPQKGFGFCYPQITPMGADLKKLKSVKFMSFTSQDIVRHHLVKEIINAYDDWEKTEKRK